MSRMAGEKVSGLPGGALRQPVQDEVRGLSILMLSPFFHSGGCSIVFGQIPG